MEKRRTVAQDAAKGLLIIAVVFFHCVLMTAVVPMEELSKFSILSALFPYILGVFFFYTGYNYVPRGRSFKESILRRAKQLLIPLVICAIISIILISSIELAFCNGDVQGTFKAIGNSILYSLMSEPLAIMIGFPKEGGTIFGLVVALGLLWFLYCLFICSIFFYLLVEHTNKKVTTLISVVIILLAISFCLGEFVGVYLPYTVQCYPVVLAIMLTAAYLRQSHFLTKRITTKKEIVFHAINAVVAEGIIVGICFLAYYKSGATLTGSLPGGMFDPTLAGLDAFVTYLFSILGTYFIHTVCRLFRHIPVAGKCLQWLGNHCAIFYLFHPIPLTLIHHLFVANQVDLGAGQPYVYVAFVVSFLILTCLAMDYIGKKRNVARPIKDEIDDNKDPEED